ARGDGAQDPARTLRAGGGDRAALAVPALVPVRLDHGRVPHRGRRHVAAAADVGAGEARRAGRVVSAERALPPTEAASDASRELDALSLAAAFDVFDAADEAVNAAVRAAKPAIVRAIELVSARLARGGRLLYAGAGTSGRLGVLDAAEC